jgi:hypothetical protein
VLSWLTLSMTAVMYAMVLMPQAMATETCHRSVRL